MATTVDKLEKEYAEAQRRHHEGIAAHDQAVAALKEVVARAADAPAVGWPKLAAEHAQITALAAMASAAVAILAGREHAALVAVRRQEVAEAEEISAKAREARLTAGRAADAADHAVRRLIAGTDPEAKALGGQEAEDYRARVFAQQAELRSRARSKVRPATVAGEALRRAREELAAVEASAPS